MTNKFIFGLLETAETLRYDSFIANDAEVDF
jgi:hypothetical protein